MQTTTAPSTAECASAIISVNRSMILKTEDLVYETLHLAHLVSMAIEGLEIDAELKAFSAGIHVIMQRLSEATEQLELARR